MSVFKIADTNINVGRYVSVTCITAVVFPFLCPHAMTAVEPPVEPPVFPHTGSVVLSLDLHTLMSLG